MIVFEGSGGMTIAAVPQESAALVAASLVTGMRAPSQARFGQYNFIELKPGERTKKVSSITGVPALWGARGNTCSWDAAKGTYTRQAEITAELMKFNGEECGDQFIGTSFERLLNKDGGLVPATQEYDDFLMTIGKVLGVTLTEGMVRAAIANGLFDTTLYQMNQGLPAEFGSQIATQNDLFTGLLKGLKNMASDLGLTYLDDTSDIFDAGYFNGLNIDPNNIIDILQALFDNLSTEPLLADLQTVVIEGGTMASDGTLLKPIIYCSPSVLGAAATWHFTHDGYMGAGDSRSITKEEVNGNTYYYYRGVPLISERAIQGYSDFFSDVKVHAVYLTVARNLTLAGGFDPITGTQYGMRVQQSDRVADQGKVFMDAFGKIGAAVADNRMITGATIVKS